MKRFLIIFSIVCFFILMLCFPKETFAGASNGLLLWFQIILPTLLPFIIISNLLVHTNAVSYISKTIHPSIQKFFSVSKNGSYAVLVGFLCGYPMGAKVISDLLKTKRISKNEGQYLLSFCNNTSPMFIISFIVMQNFKDETLLMGTLGILFLSPLICSLLFKKRYDITSSIKYQPETRDDTFVFHFRIIDECIMNGFETITKVGGYVILFSVLFSLCSKFSLIGILPMLEITNGIMMISNVGLSIKYVFPFVLAITSFGGFCSVAQTYSIICDTELSIFSYVIQKLITALVTSLFAIIYIQFIHR